MVGIESDQHIMLRTIDGGASWKYFDNGMSGQGTVNSIVFDTLNDRVYAGVVLYPGISGLYIHQGLTRVPSQPRIVDHFELDQNYPNPFNPTTTIGFTTQASGDVTVEVFDLLGRKVRSLTSGRLGPGYHKLVLDATTLPSGAYVYKLKFGDHTPFIRGENEQKAFVGHSGFADYPNCPKRTGGLLPRRL